MDDSYTGRREDPRLLTGMGRYTGDRSLPDQAAAVFLRSDLAHARIARLDIAAATKAPGVLAVLTASDMVEAGYSRGAPHLPFPGRDGPLTVPKLPALASDKVRYVGEPFALIVAETVAQARDAAELVEVGFDPLDAVADVTEALAPGAPVLHDTVPGNLPLVYEFGDAAATAAAFRTAAHIVRLDLESARVVASPMEPKAALAHWEGEVLHLWAPSQGMTGIRDAFCRATGLAPGNFRIHAEDVGGAFGVRGDAYPEYIALALAARNLRRPVKWVASRSETFVSDYQGRGLRMTGELALDAEGRFLAIRHDWLADMGGHSSGSGPVVAISNIATMACGAYRIPAVSGRVRLALTNRVPVCAYRGAGRPEAAYAVERLVDAAARQTGLDRLALRRMNMIPAADFPYPIPTAPFPTTYDSADFAALIDIALTESDWAGFEARRAAAARAGRLRGIGCALFIEPAGGVAPSDMAAITVEADGGLILHEVATASGQGHETVFPEIVARVLQIDPARITLRAGRADGPAQKGAGAFGSRSLMSQGPVLDEAARQLLTKAEALARTALGAAVEYADGSFHVPGTNRFISLDEIASAHPGALDTLAELPAPRGFPSGMHVAEVEIDPETGVTELIRYVSVDDCGTVVNRTLVLGQIWGGLMQGLGQVFGEICTYDADGQLLSGSFMDYPMPRADLARRVRIVTAGVPSPGNRLGAKGVGEAGTVGALPTAMNAILDALAPAGVTGLDMPATPLKVWQALRTARS